MGPFLLLALLQPALATADDLDALCTWSDTRWERHATLYLPGTSTPFAVARDRPSTRLDATLGFNAWDHLRMRVDLVGDDVSLSGDVRYNEARMFRLSGDDPVKLGEFGLILPGATLAVEGSHDGKALVQPGGSVLDTVRLWSRPVPVPCQRMNVHDIGPRWSGHAAVLERAGFDPDLPEYAMPRGTRVKNAPDGRRIGRFRKVDYDREVFLVERDDGWARIVRPRWQGVVFTGWVPARKLQSVDDEGGMGVLGALAGKGDPIGVHRCDSELPLFAAVPGRVAEVGTVHAGAKLELGEVHGDRVGVTFPGGWIDPVDDATLLVPGRAADCPQSTWQYEPSPAMQELLEQAEADEEAADTHDEVDP